MKVELLKGGGAEDGSGAVLGQQLWSHNKVIFLGGRRD